MSYTTAQERKYYLTDAKCPAIEYNIVTGYAKALSERERFKREYGVTIIINKAQG